MPLIGAPYLAEVEFLREVRAVDDTVEKTHFPNNIITSPFFFLLKIRELENNGAITVRFYSLGKNIMTDGAPLGELAAERTFTFGEKGKYYEYVLFFDQIRDLPPGTYRYAVLLDEQLLMDNYIAISAPAGKK